MRHLIVTPLYNEEKYLNIFITSIVKQTKQPYQLVMVDDNSSDESADIIKKFTQKYHWIKYVFHPSDIGKSQGRPVINAFNFGILQCNINEADLISKIDADLELPYDYFEQIELAFLRNSKLGITGGVIKEQKNGDWQKINQASYHIRGALKTYHINCFKGIGGLMPVLGWDGLDEMKALYMGWETKIIDTGVKHFRPAASDYDAVKLNYDFGVSNYQNGGNLLLAVARSIFKIKKKPYFKVGASFLKGYLYALQNKMPKNVDEDLAKFINKFHLKRLLY